MLSGNKHNVEGEKKAKTNGIKIVKNMQSGFLNMMIHICTTAFEEAKKTPIWND